VTNVTLDDVVAAARALGVRDVAVRGSGIITLRTVLADAQRMRFDALHAAVVLDSLFPRPGCSWRPTCCWCVDSLDVALAGSGGPELEYHRVNRDTGHDTGCCSFCGAGGRDTLVAAVQHDVFDEPPPPFLESRCAYGDGGGELARLRRGP
jgi:hypothetical protein